MNNKKEIKSSISEGAYYKPYQILFDENIISGEQSHASWQQAWGRAIAYAWKSEENEKELIDSPHNVLAKFNYYMPDGNQLKVIRANDAVDSVYLGKKAGELSYKSSNNSFCAYKIISDISAQADGLVKFSISDKADDVMAQYPVNGWVAVPPSGLVVKLNDGEYWVTKEKLTKEAINGNEFTGMPIDQMLSDENAPDHYRLGSTIIMALPPKPAGEDQVSAMMDYDALGKTYPFTT